MLFHLIFTVDYTPYGRGLPARVFSLNSGDGLGVSAAETCVVDWIGDCHCGPADTIGFLCLCDVEPPRFRPFSADVGSLLGDSTNTTSFLPLPAAGREIARQLLEETAPQAVGIRSLLFKVT